MSERTQTEEVVGYWQQIIDVMRQMSLLTERTQQGDEQVPVADAILLPERCIFVLDMQQLAGIARDVWLDPALWAQWEEALQGRRVSVSAGGGLALTVAREPTQPLSTIPLLLLTIDKPDDESSAETFSNPILINKDALSSLE